MYSVYIFIYILHIYIYTNKLIYTISNYIKLIYIMFTTNLFIIIADIQHTDPRVEVVLWVIITIVVPVRVIAHAVPLLLEPREMLSHLFHVLLVPNSVHCEVGGQCYFTVTVGSGSHLVAC